MQSWNVENPAGEPVQILGEDLVSALSRHRETLLTIAFPQGIDTIEAGWMHWDQELLGGEGGVEVILSGRSHDEEREGRLAIHAAPGEIAPDTGRPVFF
jgi:hypothetical protein